MKIEEMNLQQIKERIAELDEEQRAMTEAEDIEKAVEEKAQLLERKKELEDIEKRSRMADEIASGAEARTVEGGKKDMPEKIEVRDSKEYINAFAEYIKTGDDKQCRKLLSMNAESNGQVAVPSLVESRVRTAWDREGIMRRVKKSYLKGNLQIGFEISGDDAVIHKEGDNAPNEENLVLGIVTLIPESIKKWITISDEVMDLQGKEFLDYVYDELVYRIAKKAADELIAKIVTHTSTGSTTSPKVAIITATQIALDLVAKAIGELSDEASDPVIIMNKLTYAAFKTAQYNANFSVDPFEGLPVEFNNSLTAFSAATTGVPYMIVGDLGIGAQANFPNGEEVRFTFDDKSLAEKDLVKVVGREYVAANVVAPKAFTVVKH